MRHEVRNSKRFAAAVVAGLLACVAAPSQTARVASPGEVLWTGRFVRADGQVGWRLDPKWTSRDVCETMEMVEGESEAGSIQIECRAPETGQPLDTGDRALSLDSA